jgi:hypothetical protein
MTQHRPHRRDEESKVADRRAFDRQEFGRSLRLIGPLVQIPLLWFYLKNPDWASRNAAVLYGGMVAGLTMVLVGILLSAKR